MAEAPKTAFELAMERLAAADKDAGVVAEAPLTDAQKEEIAEARRIAASRLAEREILFRDAMKKTFEPAEREKAEQEYQVDRGRIERDRDQAIETIRARPSGPR